MVSIPCLGLTKPSRSNKVKPGIDFVEAQRFLDDPNLLQIPARTTDEPQFLVLGIIDDRHWSAVITYRSSNVRIISVRRSRVEEVALHESQSIRSQIRVR